MALAKRDCDREGLVIGEEAMSGNEAIPTDANLFRWPAAQVSNPIGVRSPRRANGEFAGLGVVSEHHGHGLVWFARPPPDVDKEQKGVAQHPPPTASVEVQRQPEHAHHQTTWAVA